MYYIQIVIYRKVIVKLTIYVISIMWPCLPSFWTDFIE